MNMSLGRRTASGILFTPTGLTFTFTEKSTTNTGERNCNRRRRRRLADTPEESTTRNSSCPQANDVGDKCTPRKSGTQSYKVDAAMASERTPRGGARRKLPRKASETAEPASHDSFQASDVPWEDYDDPYRDMRMDIDDMSYEELLALGERIGTVSTAISEEDLSKYLKRSKFKYTTIGDSVTCSICQEEFVEGDELGEVACRHVYHATCIEQWLKSKNWCPLCKGSARRDP